MSVGLFAAWSLLAALQLGWLPFARGAWAFDLWGYLPGWAPWLLGAISLSLCAAPVRAAISMRLCAWTRRSSGRPLAEVAACAALCLLLWLLPVAIAKIVMDWYINYLPHVGLPAHRYKGTRVVDVAWLTPLVLGHNYHAIHHLWPTLPWHRYRALFRERLDLLRKHGVPIEHRVFERRFPARELPAHTPLSG